MTFGFPKLISCEIRWVEIQLLLIIFDFCSRVSRQLVTRNWVREGVAHLGKKVAHLGNCSSYPSTPGGKRPLGGTAELR